MCTQHGIKVLVKLLVGCRYINAAYGVKCGVLCSSSLDSCVHSSLCRRDQPMAAEYVQD